MLRCSVLRSKASRAGYSILVTYSWYGTSIITNTRYILSHYRTPRILYPQQSIHEPPALALAITGASAISYSRELKTQNARAGPHPQNTITIRNNITITKRLDLPYTNTAGHHHPEPTMPNITSALRTGCGQKRKLHNLSTSAYKENPSPPFWKKQKNRE